MGCTSASAWPRRPKSRRRWDRIPGVPWPWPERPRGTRGGHGRGPRDRLHDLLGKQSGLGWGCWLDIFLWHRISVPLFERDVSPARLAQPLPPRPCLEDPGRRWTASGEGPEQLTASPATATSRVGQGIWCPVCHFQKPGLRTGALPAKEYWERFLNKSFMCIAPIHVRLLIGFGYSRISSYLFRPQISHAFVEKTICLVHASGGWVGSWGLLSKISLGLQDCIVTVTYTVTDVSLSSYCVTDLKSVWSCKQGSKQKIFFFHVYNNFFLKVQFALQQSVLNHLHKI